MLQLALFLAQVVGHSSSVRGLGKLDGWAHGWGGEWRVVGEVMVEGKNENMRVWGVNSGGQEYEE